MDVNDCHINEINASMYTTSWACALETTYVSLLSYLSPWPYKKWQTLSCWRTLILTLANPMASVHTRVGDFDVIIGFINGLTPDSEWTDCRQTDRYETDRTNRLTPLHTCGVIIDEGFEVNCVFNNCIIACALFSATPTHPLAMLPLEFMWKW